MYPVPPPSVNPAMPVVGTIPPVVARPKGLCFLVEASPGASRPDRGIDLDAAHPRKIDHEPAVAYGVPVTLCQRPCSSIVGDGLTRRRTSGPGARAAALTGPTRQCIPAHDPKTETSASKRWHGDLSAVLDLVVARAAVLVGHSIGGMTIMTFARLFPEILKRRVPHGCCGGLRRSVCGATHWRKMRYVTKPVLLAGLACSLCCASGAYATDATKFAALDRTAKTMEEAAAAGVSRQKFGELALDLAAALLSAKDEVRDDEDLHLLSLYARAGRAYGDSLTLWREKAARGTPHVPASLPNVAPLVPRYAIPIDGAGTVDCDWAIPLLWATARKAISEATSLSSRRALEEAEHQRRLIEQVEKEFERSEHPPERPQPFEAGVGNWTCPRGYVIRGGRCLSDEEISRLPKVEIGR
jgi:pimeloyl-ACP methyl ester carboxylesterase